MKDREGGKGDGGKEREGEREERGRERERSERSERQKEEIFVISDIDQLTLPPYQRVPKEGWTPAGWTPPTEEELKSQMKVNMREREKERERERERERAEILLCSHLRVSITTKP